jgi:preprotein translocase subunit SecE
VNLPRVKNMAVPKKKPARKEGKRPLAALVQYLKDVRAEFKKVIWPGRAEVVAATIVVLVTLVFFATLTGVLDFVFSRLTQLVIS